MPGEGGFDLCAIHNLGSEFVRHSNLFALETLPVSNTDADISFDYYLSCLLSLLNTFYIQMLIVGMSYHRVWQVG